MKIEPILDWGLGCLLVLLMSSVFGCASGRAVTAMRRAPETQPMTEKHEIFFEFNRSEVRSQDQDLLKEVAHKIEEDPKAVAILEGHADQIGEARYNEILAESRARSVRVYLRDLGADARRLAVTSKGEREPLVVGRNRKDLERNRRVEIFLTLTRGGHE